MKTSAKYFGQRLGPRRGKMSQNGPKTTSLTMSLTKNSQTPNQKFFFECRLVDPWCIRALEQRSSTIGGGAMALVRQSKTAGFRLKSGYDIFVDQPSKC